jgi:hypothetical protein
LVLDGEAANGERRGLHVVPGVPERARHVLDARLVAGRAEGPVAAVPIGDALQLGKVPEGAVAGDGLDQTVGEGGVGCGRVGAAGQRDHERGEHSSD